MSAEPELSIVIPLFNERENVAPLLSEVMAAARSLGLSFEVLVIDDGSTDGTREALDDAATESSGERIGLAAHLRVLRLDRNHGQSAALDAGFRAVRAPLVATLDGDLQNDPRDLALLLPHLERADVVCGIRRDRRDNTVRRLSSRFANAIRNWLTRESIQDTGCSLRLYRTAYLHRLKLYRGLHRFLPTLLALEGARVVEIPVSHRPRRAGRSKYGISNRALSGLRDCLVVRWMQDRQLRYRVDQAANSELD